MNRDSDERYNNGRQVAGFFNHKQAIMIRPVGVWKLAVAMALTRSHYTQKMRVKMCGSVCVDVCVFINKDKEIFFGGPNFDEF